MRSVDKTTHGTCKDELIHAMLLKFNMSDVVKGNCIVNNNFNVNKFSIFTFNVYSYPYNKLIMTNCTYPFQKFLVFILLVILKSLTPAGTASALKILPNCILRKQ